MSRFGKMGCTSLADAIATELRLRDLNVARYPAGQPQFDAACIHEIHEIIASADDAPAAVVGVAA